MTARAGDLTTGIDGTDAESRTDTGMGHVRRVAVGWLSAPTATAVVAGADDSIAAMISRCRRATIVSTSERVRSSPAGVPTPSDAEYSSSGIVADRGRTMR